MIINQLKYNKEVYVLMIGTALAQGITLLFAPLLARLYSPSEYGLLGIMLAGSNILAEFIHLKYDRTIVLEEDKKSSMNLLFFCLTSTIGFSILFLIIAVGSIYFFPSEIADYVIIVKILPPLMLAMGFIMVSNYWFQRTKNHYSIVYNKIVQMASITAVSIYLGYSSVENGLLIGYLIGWGVVFLFSIFQLYKTGVRTKEFDIHEIKQSLKKFKNFPLYNLLPSLLYTFAIGLPFFMVSIIYGETQGGYFNMCKQLLLIPCGFVALAFSQVYYRRFTESVQSKTSLNPLLRTMLFPVFLFAIFVFVLTFFFGEEIFVFVLGSNWAAAGRMSSIYVFAIVAQFISIVLMILLPVLGLIRKESIFKFIYFGAVIVLFLFPFKRMEDFIFYYTLVEFVLFTSLSLYCILKVNKYNAGLHLN